MSPTQQFRLARDLLIECRSDYEQARVRFSWPTPRRFNWAVDWFDRLATESGDRPALVVASTSGRSPKSVTFAQMAARSDMVAALWHRAGIRRGDHVVLAMGNSSGIWESMLAAMKLGAVVIPVSARLTRPDIADRVRRGQARHVVCDLETAARLDASVGDAQQLVMCEADEVAPRGWRSLGDTLCEPGDRSFPIADTEVTDPLLMYFTSGTTSTPKLVRHNHGYPIGHLATMYWIGLRPGDVHLNVAAPGWAKHLGSGLFAAWNAEATVVVHGQSRFSATAVVDVMEQLRVTTVCAPPTAWRMLSRECLAGRSLRLREAVSAGEPLDVAVIAHMRRELGVTVRDGYGQTETTHLVGNSPGQAVKAGSMGRPMPGVDVVLRGRGDDDPTTVGELEVAVPPRGIGLMDACGDGQAADLVAVGQRHRTGDLARCDEDGYLTFVGRVDEMFKASGYRVAPLEVERALLTHPAVSEVAVVPSPDRLRAWVPKAYVSLASGWEADQVTASSILLHARSTLAPHARIRRLTFAALPKTVSGKVRRGELRQREIRRHGAGGPEEHLPEWQDDGTDLALASAAARGAEGGPVLPQPGHGR